MNSTLFSALASTRWQIYDSLGQIGNLFVYARVRYGSDRIGEQRVASSMRAPTRCGYLKVMKIYNMAERAHLLEPPPPRPTPAPDRLTSCSLVLFSVLFFHVLCFSSFFSYWLTNNLSIPPAVGFFFFLFFLLV